MKPHLSFGLLLVGALLLGATACNEKPQKKQNSEYQRTIAAKTAPQLKIGYVDEDTIMANYNLAKDINEAMLRRQQQYEAAQQQRGNEIAKFGSSMEQKYKNNGYLTEESFNADQNKLAKMQSDAESYLGSMQKKFSDEMEQSQAQLIDSINNFMDAYAREKGFDMVLRKSATLFIDPKYNVTDEVVDGLNKRYVKLQK